VHTDEETTVAPAQPSPQGGRHAAPEGASVHPLIDLSRDPNPGKADHSKPDEG
jgi:hypothetical protein